eukprot:GFUD01034232.1.p1 GENE.GFUD01034232.1~~GFUD01034232.1.p1  ORF type:complete len:176 (+),score=57.25 GFUD01034232.1:38-565(+)
MTTKDKVPDIPEDLNKSHADVLATIQSGWMLRDCQSYYSELKSCESLKGRFYQFYIDGHQGDCTQWSDNHKDCKLWTNSADKEAASRIIDREKDRIKERLRGHYENDVWEKRSTPPPEEEWNKPLPQYMLDRQENSYLTLYTKLQEKKDSATEGELKIMEVQSKMVNSAPTCTIL